MNSGKSNMPAERADEALLLRYLLGNLSDEEQVQVEDWAFSDAEHLRIMQNAEADLVDSYVRGELPVADRRKFEGRFLTSLQRRNKVEFARALAQVAAEFTPSRPAVQQRQSPWQALLNMLRGFHPAVQFAAGMALLVVVVGASWVAVQNASMRSRVSTLEAQRIELENRERTLRQQLSQPARAPEAQRSPGPAERAPLIAPLVFLSGIPRGETRGQQLTLAPGTRLAHMEIQLEPRDDFPRFRVELHTRGGDDVLTLSGLSRRRTNGAYSVSFDVPASTLPRGEYELALEGVSDTGATDIGFYYFRVQKQ
jgi:hypothetical protein